MAQSVHRVLFSLSYGFGGSGIPQLVVTSPQYLPSVFTSSSPSCLISLCLSKGPCGDSHGHGRVLRGTGPCIRASRNDRLPFFLPLSFPFPLLPSPVIYGRWCRGRERESQARSTPSTEPCYCDLSPDQEFASGATWPHPPSLHI